jgi:predicted site-specific integrase-resolvase
MGAQIFRTPEDVAPELGMSKTELRRYCRESGHCTRLSKNKIMLHEDDVAKIVNWVRERNAPTPAEVELDPFA